MKSESASASSLTDHFWRRYNIVVIRLKQKKTERSSFPSWLALFPPIIIIYEQSNLSESIAIVDITFTKLPSAFPMVKLWISIYGTFLRSSPYTNRGRFKFNVSLDCTLLTQHGTLQSYPAFGRYGLHLLYWTLPSRCRPRMFFRWRKGPLRWGRN